MGLTSRKWCQWEDRDGIVSIWRSVEKITGWIQRQEKIGLIVESDSFERKEPIQGVGLRERLTSSPPFDVEGIKVIPMSGVGTMECQVGSKRSDRRIYASGEPYLAGHTDTGNISTIVYCVHHSDEPGILSSLGGVYATRLLDLIKFFTYHTSFL